MTVCYIANTAVTNERVCFFLCACAAMKLAAPSLHLHQCVWRVCFLLLLVLLMKRDRF